MLDISKEAAQQLKEFKERSGPELCVRIGILSGSSKGSSLGVSVDVKTDTDESFVFGDLEVIIDEALIKYCEKINIEYVLQKGGGCSSGGGFRLTPKNKI